jgi:hypothetical protein
VNEDCLKLTTYFGEHDRLGRLLLTAGALDLASAGAPAEGAKRALAVLPSGKALPSATQLY